MPPKVVAAQQVGSMMIASNMANLINRIDLNLKQRASFLNKQKMKRTRPNKLLLQFAKKGFTK